MSYRRRSAEMVCSFVLDASYIDQCRGRMLNRHNLCVEELKRLKSRRKAKKKYRMDPKYQVLAGSSVSFNMPRCFLCFTSIYPLTLNPSMNRVTDRSHGQRIEQCKWTETPNIPNKTCTQTADVRFIESSLSGADPMPKLIPYSVHVPTTPFYSEHNRFRASLHRSYPFIGA